MPRLAGHYVVYHLRLFDRISKLSVSLRVPALIQPVNVILADKIEIVLVLSDHEIVVMEVVYEFVQHEMQPELLAVYEHKSRIEKVVA